MPDYYSYYSPEIDSVKNLFQAVARQQMSEAQALQIAKERYGNLSDRNFKTVFDSHVIVYTVNYYKKGVLIPATMPILATNFAKRAIPLRPNIQKKSKIRLKRKYPEN